MEGVIAQGEFGWNPSARDIEAFKKAHAQREYGFRPEDNRMAFLDELEKAVFFFDGALVTSGRRNPAWGTTAFTLMELPDKTKPGAWSELYKDKIAQAKIEAGRYEKIVRVSERQRRRHYAIAIRCKSMNRRITCKTIRCASSWP